MRRLLAVFWVFKIELFSSIWSKMVSKRPLGSIFDLFVSFFVVDFLKFLGGFLKVFARLYKVFYKLFIRSIL